MLQLISAILSSFAITVIIKLNEQQELDRQVVLGINYIFAAGLGWALTLFNGGLASISMTTILLGFGGGILWPGGFYLFMWGIKKFGMSLTGSIARLSLSVPILIAVIFLGEILTLPTIFGLVATLFAFFLISPVKFSQLKQSESAAIWFFPLIVFIFGIVDFWANLFNTIGDSQEKFLFMTLIFTFSGVNTWIVIFFKKRKVSLDAVKAGALLGVPNFFSTYFLLEALRDGFFIGQSATVYTLYSVAGLTLAFCAGAIFWKEKVGPKNIAGVVIAIVAIILLNL